MSKVSEKVRVKILTVVSGVVFVGSIVLGTVGPNYSKSDAGETEVKSGYLRVHEDFSRPISGVFKELSFEPEESIVEDEAKLEGKTMLRIEKNLKKMNKAIASTIVKPILEEQERAEYSRRANEEWRTVRVEGKRYDDVYVPHKEARISYESFRCLTAPTSLQRKMQELPGAYTNEDGIRSIGNRIMVAVGSGFVYQCGVPLDIHLTNGKVIKCITGDVKANEHTDVDLHVWSGDGSAVEFIVDQDYMDSTTLSMGSFNYIEEYDGVIDYVRVYKKNLFPKEVLKQYVY